MLFQTFINVIHNACSLYMSLSYTYLIKYKGDTYLGGPASSKLYNNFDGQGLACREDESITSARRPPAAHPP